MSKTERLKEFFELISRSQGGMEKVMADLAGETGQAVGEGFESAPALASGSTRRAAMRAMEALATGRAPAPNEEAALEAIIDEDLRPAFQVVNGTFVADHPLWRHLTDDATVRSRIEQCLPSIGRIELPGHRRLPYAGTGFVVGKDLVMTNRHVAEVFASGLGERGIVFKDGITSGIDFLREHGRPTGPTHQVRKVVMIHPYWDMALLEVPGISTGRQALRLALADARDLVARPIFVVGYPAFDPRNPAGVQEQLFGGRYGSKRLQPGELQGGFNTASFGKLVPAATHDCSTLGGNSGSAVIDLETGEVMAVHFGGAYHQRNYAVPSAALSRDGRVVDTGVQFAGTAPRGPNDWSHWWNRSSPPEAPLPPQASGGALVMPAASSSSPQAAAGVVVRANAGAVVIRLSGAIEIEVGAPASGREEVMIPAADGLEGLREPFHDEDYATREGYDDSFLGAGAKVPLPRARNEEVLAKGRDGARILHYQNFSVAMHARRRLALFAASNISREPKLRKPDPDAAYSRKELGGLGKNDQEKWFLDPRLDEKYQLPDVFFTKDRQAFDKGHIVRREDVAWGRTYEELRRANGDSYHVTNCSPQVGGFNRSNLGSENWGDLENVVLANAASERLCVFAGPVLKASDEVFVGVGAGGTPIRARIPSSYWKVVVCRGQDGIESYGFVLEQDLSDVEWEFVVPNEFVPALHPIARIEEMTGIDFGAAVRDADRYGTVAGTELVLQGIAVWRPPA